MFSFRELLEKHLNLHPTTWTFSLYLNLGSVNENVQAGGKFILSSSVSNWNEIKCFNLKNWMYLKSLYINWEKDDSSINFWVIIDKTAPLKWLFNSIYFYIKCIYSKTSFIGTLIYRDLHLSGSRNLIYRDNLFLLQPPLLVHSDIVFRCFICRSFIMSILLHAFVCISIFIFHHEKPNKFT